MVHMLNYMISYMRMRVEVITITLPDQITWEVVGWLFHILIVSQISFNIAARLAGLIVGLFIVNVSLIVIIIDIIIVVNVFIDC